MVALQITKGAREESVYNSLALAEYTLATQLTTWLHLMKRSTCAGFEHSSLTIG